MNGNLNSDEEHEVVALISDSEKEEVELPPSQRPRPRPRPKRAYRLRSDDEDEGAGPRNPPSQSTPRAKRVTATYSRTPKRNGVTTFETAGDSQEVDDTLDDMLVDDAPHETLEEPEVANFRSKRKRIAMH
jgi:hypothetical protein